MIIVQNKLATTTFYEEEKMLVSIYSGRINFELAKAHSDILLDFYRTNKVRGTLIDISKLYGSFAKLMDYYKNGFPVAVGSGLKYIAYVVSDDIITQNLIQKVKDMAVSFELKVSIFKSVKEAEKWLKECIQH